MNSEFLLKNMYEDNFPKKRFTLTMDFLKKTVPAGSNILDLGVANPFSEMMINEGYNVTNTSGEDLDLDTSAVKSKAFEVVTAFEIFEHLVSPFTVLQDIKANKLVASVPLRLWFSSAYQSKTDIRDRHFHEFEDWQFDWLLEKAGWQIKKRVKFPNPINKIGVRPILRSITPRYYLVYAEKK